MICSESAARLRQRLVSDFTLANMNHSKIVALILMCSSSLYCLFYIKLRDVGDRNFRFNYMNLSFFEDWSSPPLRWVPVQNKSEYVGEMANATLPFLKLDSPETKELLDGNVDCSKPWVTIPTSGQLGSNVMQTFFVYNLRFKHKLQAGMTRPMWDYLRKVFPYTHHRLLPPDCLKQLKGMKKVTHNTIIGELAKKDGQRHFLVQPAIHPLDELWYLRKVLIEEFRFAEHILVEARLVLENLLDKWRQRMSTIEPQRLSGCIWGQFETAVGPILCEYSFNTRKRPYRKRAGVILIRCGIPHPRIYASTGGKGPITRCVKPWGTHPSGYRNTLKAKSHCKSIEKG
ncbi:uncharacterized protein LOC143038163 [Oratosquilla oratoria]|uniref:uncharacterized protein LOC143038163 n=1 Tax=Oratosquilla oratoria TaxID=337810 RepID=UPI003F76C7E9